MLSHRDANNITFGCDLEEGDVSRDKRLAAAPKSLRRTLIEDNPSSDEAISSAAIEIQRTWRGYKSRCGVYGAVNPKVSSTAVYSGSSYPVNRLQDLNVESQENLPPGRQKLEQYYMAYVQKMLASGAADFDIASFENFCANFIQNWWYKHRRKREAPGSIRQATISKQSKKKRDGPLTQFQAASIIQRSWRRHIDTQVYKYYRDLIDFKTRGDPGMMLRCINPGEAKMLDSASGIHVRFRLAGERFPPNIYYKIYTHRPIQDLCANSPKDYTKPQAKAKMARDAHNRNRPQIGGYEKDGWYQRSDNNGWRLVSDRLIHHLMSDPITWETSNKKYVFHHDRLHRRQDVDRMKKQKKIGWMKKMYQEGMLKAKAEDPETVNLIEGAAAGMVATVDKHGPDALEDWEVDELLDWTTSLNFDDYLSSWKDLATSSHSAKHMEDKLRLYTNAMDPYEFSLSTNPSQYQSTQQSHNTPASSVSGRIPVN